MATLTAYSFYWYSPNSGDYYYGTVYDDGTYGYYVGQTVYGPNSGTETGALDGYYVIIDAATLDTSDFQTGYVTRDPAYPYYYDGQSGTELLRYDDSMVVIGYSGLGSESDYAYYSESASTLQIYRFGYDYYEADLVLRTLTAYDFYWYSPNSGDYYYGTVYDDGTYGYQVGLTVYGLYSYTESGDGDG